MAKHTQGPWFAREQTHKDGSSLGWIIEHDNGRIGWSSYATAEPNEGELPPYPIGAANARLMAAAPDLLFALNWIAAQETDRSNATVRRMARIAREGAARVEALSTPSSIGRAGNV